MRRIHGQPRLHAPGLTLIELLVALGVLGIISMAFATIMSQSQEVADRSNVLMRANATAAAVAQVIRDDLASMTPDGFLAIHEDADDPNYQYLVFTAIGPFTDHTGLIEANVARIEYGRSDPNADDWEDDFLWRRAVLLTGKSIADPYGDADLTDDVDPAMWLGGYNLPTVMVDSRLMEHYLEGKPDDIPMEVIQPSDLDLLWSLLARPCGSFRVTWWENDGWKEEEEKDSRVWKSGDDYPPAIKINFTITTGGGFGDYLEYEVICPIRQ